MRTVLLMALLLAGVSTPAHTQGTANPHGPNIGACATCHRADSWRPARISRDFRHAERTFPLQGAHERTDCTACHRSLEFSKAPTACAQCHRDVHKAELGSDCGRCHTTRSFVDQTNLKRMHELTSFPLRGAHAPLACEACHTAAQPGQSQYLRRPTTCISCHVATYRQTSAPDHQAAQFPQDCTLCHTMSGWTGGRFDHATTQFPLVGAHATVACAGCHGDGVFRGKATTCVGCHQADYTWTKTPPHAASGFPTTCLTCHTVTTWKGSTFDHNASLFPLTGAHRAAVCSGCHVDNVYKGTSTACLSCHQRSYDASTRPPHSQLAFSTACATCHGTSVWTGAPFDHATTAFPLTGAHRTATCANCHADGAYRGRPSTCVACHQGNYTASRNPPHASAGFPTACEQCHSTTAWLGTGFDHAQTTFPLAGAHRTVLCTACHGDGVYRGKSAACLSCHQPAYVATRLPPHSQLGFSTACATCHSTTSWSGGTFDHNTSAFPLTGAHRTATCANCHADGVYRGRPSTCVACHQGNYASTTAPSHAAAGYPTTCQQCHGTTSWFGSGFDHASTTFPLLGAHRAVACASCHGDGVYRGRSSACLSCHQSAYTASLRPPHSQLGFSSVCTVCHAMSSWSGGTFDHNTSPFPLTGAHRTATCNSCHADGAYRGRPSTCLACHQANYAATSRPAHAASGFPTTCQECHSTTAWLGSGFDHSLTTFPLVGAHRTVVCTSCHADGVYRGKSTACLSCHQAAYTASGRPPHSQLGFSTVCSTCHTMVAWAGGTFDHNTTHFALAGAHRAVACSGCHGDGVYRGKPTLCASCHQARYNAATSPPHAAAGFPTTCEVCHGTTAWTPATFSHSATRFPLTGAHATKSCASCHGDGVYRGKPMTCVSCHQAVYTATTNPNHAAAHFPAACESCHTTTRWTGATFNHDASFFPIYSGKHKSKWTVCADCHTVSTNYASFSCFSCHRQTEMDKEHKGRAGYRYESALCYQCHPRGSE